MTHQMTELKQIIDSETRRAEERMGNAVGALDVAAEPCAEPLVVLGAAKLGKTRLIDNLEV